MKEDRAWVDTFEGPCKSLGLGRFPLRVGSANKLPSNVPLCINSIEVLRVGDSVAHVGASSLHLYSEKNAVLMKSIIKH
jgi:hypothetical protein